MKQLLIFLNQLETLFNKKLGWFFVNGRKTSENLRLEK